MNNPAQILSKQSNNFNFFKNNYQKLSNNAYNPSKNSALFTSSFVIKS